MKLAVAFVTGVVLAGCTQPAPSSSGTGQASQTAAPAPIPAAVPIAVRGNAIETEVPLEADGGTFVVPVSINDTIVLKFTIDSGASDVSIPADVVSTLVRSGTITRDDFIGERTFMLADGTTVPSAEFRIRTLKVGTLILHDVTASLSNAKGGLLLGQSFLSRLSNWSIDNQRHALLLKAAPGEAAEADAAPTVAMAQSETSTLLADGDLAKVAAQFNDALHTSGMSGVSEIVSGCYASIPTASNFAARKRAAYCVTLDLLGLNFDADFRKEMQARTSKEMPPVPFYEPTEWQPRVSRYMPLTTPTHVVPPVSVFQTYERGAEEKLSALISASNGTSSSK
jgi:clan AA aspartic protease (TIGR02281 family)